MHARVDPATVASEPFAPAQLGARVLERRCHVWARANAASASSAVSSPRQRAAVPSAQGRQCAAPGLRTRRASARLVLETGPDLTFDEIAHPLHVVGLGEAGVLGDFARAGQVHDRGLRVIEPELEQPQARVGVIAIDRLPLRPAVVSTRSA